MGRKNGEHQQRPLSNSPHGGGGLCATDVPVEPPRILIPRRLEALKDHVRQEAAIVSKHAETSQKPPSLSLSRQYFCFAKAGPSSRKSTSHMAGGGSPDLYYYYFGWHGSAALKEACLAAGIITWADR